MINPDAIKTKFLIIFYLAFEFFRNKHYVSKFKAIMSKT